MKSRPSARNRGTEFAGTFKTGNLEIPISPPGFIGQLEQAKPGRKLYRPDLHRARLPFASRATLTKRRIASAREGCSFCLRRQWSSRFRKSADTLI